ncbi:hypothetical protein I4F81_001462 [Pyropia yezoensis]|uniref:Uncharacterized protein n=1 Tax=Pyropia yezoensis TaxID=2788 RepID=A0ACC3BM14_PYRYE|nr:hypothetical protein I4F81_001462 [Neopyropia yezoensis]
MRSSAVAASAFTIRATVTAAVFIPDPLEEQGKDKVYAATVRRSFKGCLPRRIELVSGANSALCGVTLQVGTTYLFVLRAADGAGKYRVSSCDTLRVWSEVSWADRKTLAGANNLVCPRSPWVFGPYAYKNLWTADGEKSGVEDVWRVGTIASRAAWFLAGVANNTPYVVFLSAAEDLLPARAGTLLAAAVLPGLATKVALPALGGPPGAPVAYPARLAAVVATLVAAAAVVATRPARPAVTLAAVAAASAGGGLGEATLLALAGRGGGWAPGPAAPAPRGCSAPPAGGLCGPLLPRPHPPPPLYGLAATQLGIAGTLLAHTGGLLPGARTPGALLPRWAVTAAVAMQGLVGGGAYVTAFAGVAAWADRTDGRVREWALGAVSVGDAAGIAAASLLDVWLEQADGGAAEHDAGAAEHDAEAAEQDVGAAEPDVGADEQEGGAAKQDEGAVKRDEETAEQDADAAELVEQTAKQDEGTPEGDEEAAERDKGVVEQDMAAAEHEEGAAEQGKGAAEPNDVASEQDDGAAERDAGMTEQDAWAGWKDVGTGAQNAGTPGWDLQLPPLTVKAGPLAEGWPARHQEELATFAAAVEVNRQSQREWFSITPNDTGTRWTGTCWAYFLNRRFQLDVVLTLPPAFPLEPPAVALPALAAATAAAAATATTATTTAATSAGADADGRVLPSAQFADAWARRAPAWGVVHALAAGLGPWLAVHVPDLVAQGVVVEAPPLP